MDSFMRYCNRCIWLDGGGVMRMDGDVQEVISAYVEAVMNVKSGASVHDFEGLAQNCNIAK